mmetsp:Transcript_17003/g.1523  ORF Transcript_17003/g.1523 Transcript_17003/m.1523 type:complete len:89 (-) Transcript_17003:107-373(-)
MDFSLSMYFLLLFLKYKSASLFICSLLVLYFKQVYVLFSRAVYKISNSSYSYLLFLGFINSLVSLNLTHLCYLFPDSLFLDESKIFFY